MLLYQCKSLPRLTNHYVMLLRAPYSCTISVISPPRRPPGRPARAGELPRRIELPRISDPLGPIAPNPCIPIFPHCNYKKYKYISFMVCFPLIMVLMVHVLLGEHQHVSTPCVPYEYLNIRTHRFPWGDGTKSLIWNEKLNRLNSACDERECAEQCPY